MKKVDYSDLPFSPACERNWSVILEVLKQWVRPEDQYLLEVGSGTGQHATSIAPQLPSLQWVCSDREEYHETLRARLAIANEAHEVAGAETSLAINKKHDENSFKKKPKKILGPESYEIGKNALPSLKKWDLIYTANTLHIMSWALCQVFFREVGESLEPRGRFVVYGPFNYNGEFTSESNKEFDQMLRERDPLSGIRQFEEVVDKLNSHGLELASDTEMPANNRVLVFCKK